MPNKVKANAENIQLLIDALNCVETAITSNCELAKSLALEIKEVVPFLKNKRINTGFANASLQTKQFVFYKTVYELLKAAKINLRARLERSSIDDQPKRLFDQSLHQLNDIFKNHYSDFLIMMQTPKSNNVLLYLYFLDLIHHQCFFHKDEFSSMTQCFFENQTASMQSLLIFLSPLSSENNAIEAIMCDFSSVTKIEDPNQQLIVLGEKLSAFKLDFSLYPNFFSHFLKYIFISFTFKLVEDNPFEVSLKQFSSSMCMAAFGFEKKEDSPLMSFLGFYSHLRRTVQCQMLAHSLYQRNQIFYRDLLNDITERHLKEFSKLSHLDNLSIEELIEITYSIEVLLIHINSHEKWPLKYLNAKVFYLLCAKVLLKPGFSVDESFAFQWHKIMGQVTQGLLKHSQYEVLLSLISGVFQLPRYRVEYENFQITDYQMLERLLIYFQTSGHLQRLEDVNVPNSLSKPEKACLSLIFVRYMVNALLHAADIDLLSDNLAPTIKLFKSFENMFKNDPDANGLREQIVELRKFLFVYSTLKNSRDDSIFQTFLKNTLKIELFEHLFEDKSFSGIHALRRSLITSLKQLVENHKSSSESLNKLSKFQILSVLRFIMPVLKKMHITFEEENGLKLYFSEFSGQSSIVQIQHQFAKYVNEISSEEISACNEKKQVEAIDQQQLSSGDIEAKKKKRTRSRKKKKSVVPEAMPVTSASIALIDEHNSSDEDVVSLSGNLSAAIIGEKIQEQVTVSRQLQGLSATVELPILRDPQEEIEDNEGFQLVNRKKTKKKPTQAPAQVDSQTQRHSKPALKKKMNVIAKPFIDTQAKPVEIHSNVDFPPLEDSQIEPSKRLTYSIKSKTDQNAVNCAADTQAAKSQIMQPVVAFKLDKEMDANQAIKAPTAEHKANASFSKSTQTVLAFNSQQFFQPVPVIAKDKVPRVLYELSVKIEREFGLPLVLTGKAVSVLYTAKGNINDYDCLVCNVHLEQLMQKFLLWGYSSFEIRGKINPIIFMVLSDGDCSFQIDISSIVFDETIGLNQALFEDASRRDLINTAMHLPLYKETQSHFLIYDYLKVLPYIEQNIVDINAALENRIKTTSNSDFFSDDPIRLLRLIKELIEQKAFPHTIGSLLNYYLSHICSPVYQFNLWHGYLIESKDFKVNRSKVQTKLQTIFSRYPLPDIFNLFSLFNLIEGLTGLSKSKVNDCFEIATLSSQGNEKSAFILFYLSICSVLFMDVKENSKLSTLQNNNFFNILYLNPSYLREIRALDAFYLKDEPINRNECPLASTVQLSANAVLNLAPSCRAT